MHQHHPKAQTQAVPKRIIETPLLDPSSSAPDQDHHTLCQSETPINYNVREYTITQKEAIVWSHFVVMYTNNMPYTETVLLPCNDADTATWVVRTRFSEHMEHCPMQLSSMGEALSQCTKDNAVTFLQTKMLKHHEMTKITSQGRRPHYFYEINVALTLRDAYFQGPEAQHIETL